jgi:hypothetical protein
VGIHCAIEFLVRDECLGDRRRTGYLLITIHRF